jgi:hypothetical protein
MDELQDHTVVFCVDSLLPVGDLDLGQYLPSEDRQLTSSTVRDPAQPKNAETPPAVMTR